ncbi:hypothetical protein HJG60_009350 [Phyllostomus discolor]|uniref:Uncharacterized protein n=1 Tax=Phyllostomus discolor TaxID=89673 RepID=A0A833YFI6_9CHIR|nr:hypothetical protein HJG60_009350 [Phyllostomus discolor]
MEDVYDIGNALQCHPRPGSDGWELAGPGQTPSLPSGSVSSSGPKGCWEDGSQHSAASRECRSLPPLAHGRCCIRDWKGINRPEVPRGPRGRRCMDHQWGAGFLSSGGRGRAASCALLPPDG